MCICVDFGVETRFRQSTCQVSQRVLPMYSLELLPHEFTKGLSGCAYPPTPNPTCYGVAHNAALFGMKPVVGGGDQPGLRGFQAGLTISDSGDIVPELGMSSPG